MNCLVLGGGGFIGSHLCDELVRRGHAIRVFEKKGRSRLNLAHMTGTVEWREGDFLNPEDLKDAVAGMDIVFHLISSTLPANSNQNPTYDIESNIVPTIHLLDACRDAGVNKVIFISSGGTVYGIPRTIPIPEDHPTDPICAYGIQKLMIEKYLALYHNLYGLDYTVARVANPYGERQDPTGLQGAVPVFLARALRGEPIEVWGDGSVVRDYLHISDVVRAMVMMAGNSGPHRILNIGSGKGIALNELLKAIGTIAGHDLDIRYTPGRPFDVPANVLDITRAATFLNWRPEIDLISGLRRTAAALGTPCE